MIDWDEIMEQAEERRRNRTLYQKVKDFVTESAEDIYDAWWGIMHRVVPKHRYNMLPTGLPPGYYDPDTQITHAVFTCARKFVLSDGAGMVDWEAGAGHAEAWGKLTKAVAWWEAASEAERDRGFMNEKEAELDEHLQNIISVLGYMWYP